MKKSGVRSAESGVRAGGLSFGIALAVLVLFMAPVPAPASAPPTVDSVTLVEHPDRYDGKVITFIGEAIGDVMERSDGAWININDDAYSRQGQKRRLAGYNSGQSVLATKSAAKAIKRLGDYNNRGDRVSVTGLFHKACPDHGGDMMIHAESLVVIKPGFSLPHPITPRKAGLAFVWLTAGAVVLSLWVFRNKKLFR